MIYESGSISPSKNSEELYKMEGFYRKESGTRRTLAKTKEQNKFMIGK